MTMGRRLAALLLSCAVLSRTALANDEIRAILEKIYDNTMGDGWENDLNWLEGKNYCNWYGVVCDAESTSTGHTTDDGADDDGNKANNDDDGNDDGTDDDATDDDGDTAPAGNIVALRLGGNNMAGTLPHDVFLLPALKELDVKDNGNMTVRLKHLNNATNLEVLYISGVDINQKHMAGIGGAPWLKELHLTGNDISGQVPEELFNLVELEELYLAFNNFNGSFPAGFFKMTSLKQFYAYDNLWSGGLPDGFGAFSKMRHMILGGNAFTGSLVPSLQDMPELRELSIRNIRDTFELSGPGFSGPMLSFSSQLHLRTLNLDHHGLNGTLPVDLLSGLKSPQKTVMVNLTHNELEGFFPAEYGDRFKKLILDVTDNKLTGFGEGLCANPNVANWMGEDGTGTCNSIMCEANASSELGRDTPDDLCAPCELPDGYVEFDDDDSTGDDGDDRRRLGRWLQVATDRMAQDTTNDFLPADLTPYFGKKQCEYLSTDFATNATVIVDKTGDSVEPVSTDFTQERAILMELYTALNGDAWEYKDHWTEENKSICLWYGITCDVVKVEGDTGDASVQRINLDGNNLVGSLPPSIYDLPALEELSLMRNALVITFDNIASATELRNLYLEGTQISSVEGLENASPNLKKLILSDNALAGPFPTNLFALGRLSELLIDDNALTGTLPEAMTTSWPKMERFDVTRNSFNGPLPSFDGWNSSIRVLDLSDNPWSGALPASLSSMDKLEVLAIYGRNDDAELGLSGPLPAFNACPELMELYLEDNQLTGSIPSDFLEANTHTNRTVYVALSRNQISGTVPGSLAKFDRMTLTLDDNQITELDQSLCDKTEWMEGEVKINGCAAILCPPGHYHSEIGRATKLLGPCGSCPALLASPVMGGTQCDATINQERDILQEFYEATNGNGWEDSSGWGDANTPLCNWVGVQCEDEDNDVQSGVVMIELPANNLVGALPSSVFTLPKLEQLDLSKNELLEIKFDGIHEAQQLSAIRISGTKTPSLTGLDQARSHKMLHFEAENVGLSGKFPSELGALAGLQSLDVSSNALTGELPGTIGDWANLTHLYLDENQFGGQINSHIGKLLKLQELELSFNRFSGSLPRTLNNIETLETLGARDQKDINGNSTLTGKLLSFRNSKNLRNIYLQNNAITGDIPSRFLEKSLGRDDSVGMVLYIALDNNELTGEVPATLAGLGNLVLDLGGNQITNVPAGICNQTEWQNGGVGSFGCNAMLCPKGFYLPESGRQVVADKPCLECSVEKGAQFMGSTTCESKSEASAQPVLEKVYDSLGGAEWWNSQNWKSSMDVCTWHGVNCTDSKEVTGILLGANNLKGKVPSELWSIPTLETVWLYSNPDIDLTFDGLEQATKLKTLLIDATELTSIDGLEKAASSLEYLDLRFNRLSGEFPYPVISKLTKLKSLSIANNQMTGVLVSYGFDKLTQLQNLRLGGNQFKGDLPDFADFTQLQTLDLSSNFFRGAIPPTFLSDVSNTNAPMVVDLAQNELEGTIPAAPFIRFNDLTLYVRQNYFIDVEKPLCDKNSWNNGDVGKYGCDGLVCPRYTYSESGRQKSDGTPCQACDKPTAYFAGSIECAMEATVVKSSAARLMVTSVAATMGAFLLGAIFLM